MLNPLTGHKHCGKRRKCWLQAFSLFFPPPWFQKHPMSESFKPVTNSLHGKELTLYQMTKF